MLSNIIPKKTKEYTEICYVVGEDDRIVRKALVSTGAFFRDDPNSFAYDTLTPCMGALVINDRNNVRHLAGNCAILFEPSAQPYIFTEGDWSKQAQSKATILYDGRMEGIRMVTTGVEDDAKWERYMPVLYICLGLLALVTVLACVAAGSFDALGEAF